jgi:hypothetical protein
VDNDEAERANSDSNHPATERDLRWFQHPSDDAAAFLF